MDLLSFSNFHKAFASKLGFPDFYGQNMNAWIDCMTDVDVGAMSQVEVGEGNVLTIQIDNCKTFKDQAFDVWEALVECSAFVNWRRVEQGQNPALALSFRSSKDELEYK